MALGKTLASRAKGRSEWEQEAASQGATSWWALISGEHVWGNPLPRATVRAGSGQSGGLDKPHIPLGTTMAWEPPRQGPGREHPRAANVCCVLLLQHVGLPWSAQGSGHREVSPEGVTRHTFAGREQAVESCLLKKLSVYGAPGPVIWWPWDTGSLGF